MNKYDPSAYSHHYVHVNGIHLHYVDENTTSDKILLLLHGWPDLWIGWREQIHFLVQLGYRVIVPSLRGFGESDAPDDPSHYGLYTASKDMACLLDYLNIPVVTVIGHDWGGALTFRFAQFFPDRVKAVASFCTPYNAPRTHYMSLEQIVQVLPNFDYQLYLRTPEAEEDLNNNIGKFLRLLYRPPDEMRMVDMSRHVSDFKDMAPSHLLPSNLMDYYIQCYSKHGARGGLNWYKQTRRDYEESKHLSPRFDKPTLMVVAEEDIALPPSMSQNMGENVPNLERHVLSGCGHWILWEKPEECNRILKDWLSKIYNPTVCKL